MPGVTRGVVFYEHNQDFNEIVKSSWKSTKTTRHRAKQFWYQPTKPYIQLGARHRFYVSKMVASAIGTNMVETLQALINS